MKGKRVFKQIRVVILIIAMVMTMQGFSYMGSIEVKAEGDYVASVTIGSDTTSYTTFEEALNAANGQTATLTILKDFSLNITSYGQYQLTSGKVLLELNGHTITSSYVASNYHTLGVAGGELTITGTGGITGSNDGSTISVIGGVLNIYSGNYISTQTNNNCRGLTTWNGSGVINIYGGIFSGYRGISSYGVGSTIKLYGGTFVGSAYAIYTTDHSVGSLLADGYVYRQNGTKISNLATLDGYSLPAGTVTVAAEVPSSIQTTIEYTNKTTASVTVVVSGASITTYKLTDTSDATHTYSSTNGQFTGISIGEYTLVVTDTEGQEETQLVTVAAPVATVEINGTPVYYTYFPDAWKAAQKAENATITLLQDVTMGDGLQLYYSQGNVTLDIGTYLLKGNVNSLTPVIQVSGGKLVIHGTGTIQNTSSYCIGITAGILIINDGNYLSGIDAAALYVQGGDITIHGGYLEGTRAIDDRSSISGILLKGGILKGSEDAINRPNGNIGLLLADGYGYQKEDGSWINDTSISSVAGKVTVKKSPIDNISATSDKESVPYHYTNSDAPTLTASMIKSADYTESLTSYQWYAITGNAGNTTETLIDEATADTYTVPTGLIPGTHTYRVKATVSGYIMSADVNVIVDKLMPTVDDFTYTAPTDPIYDGNKKEATVIAAQGVNGLGTIEVSCKKEGEIVGSPIDAGTYSVYVTTANGTLYEDVISLAMGNFTIDKAKQSDLSISYPTASDITYGQKLSASTLTGGSTTLGSFAWEDGDVVPNVTNSGYDVIFTPGDNTMKNYEITTSFTGIVEVSVNKATPTVTVNAAISRNAGNCQATLTATVIGEEDGEAPVGTVKFVDSTNGSDVDIAGATAVTISSGKAIYTWMGLAEQIYKVKAVYSGNGNYNTATSTEFSFDTNKQNQSVLSIGNIGTKTYGDGSFTLSTTGGSGDGAVSFTSSDPTIVSISGTTAMIHKAGNVTLTATKAATDDYHEATTSLALNVGKKELTIKADSKPNVIKGAAMPTLTYTVIGLVSGDTFISPTQSTTATDTNTVGEYDITISGGTLGNADNYIVNYTGGKLIIINEPVSPGGSPDSGSFNGGGSSTATPQTETGTPVMKGASNKAGWKAIKEQISQTREGDTVTIEMNGSLVVPGEALDAIKGIDTTLVFDIGDGITWSINGQNITDNSLKDIDFGVTLDTDAIPEELLGQMAREHAFSTLSLAYDGPFGFTSILTINLNEINAGKLGNLFYYDPDTKQLTLQALAKIGEKGTVELPFPHASDYVVIISDEPMLEKTLDQIAISDVQGTLYVGGTEKKSMSLKLELPQLLKEAVEKDSSILGITYQSSNPKVATVNALGKITAKKAGKTTITTLVTINGVQRKFQTKITVSKAYIKLVKSTNTLKTGNTFTYKVIGYGVKAEDIMFYTSKKSIVVINKTTGKAKARTTGTEYIIAKAGKVIVKMKVKVS